MKARHGGADAENLITEAVAGAEQEHRLVFELIGTHIGAVHPRVMRGYGHDHVLFIDLLGHEARVGERVGGDGHINLPRAKLVEQLRSEVLFKEERHFGRGNGHRTDELRQKIGRNRINHAEAQRSRERILTAVGNVDDAAAFFEHLLGLSDYLRADGRDGNVVRTTFEERDAEFFFELFDSYREGRLAHAAAFCGAAEVPLPRDSDNVFQFSECHDGNVGKVLKNQYLTSCSQAFKSSALAENHLAAWRAACSGYCLSIRSAVRDAVSTSSASESRSAN